MTSPSKRLLEALAANDVRGALDALEQGADPRAHIAGGPTALGLAASVGALEVMEKLFSLGVMADERDQAGFTALLMAARHGQTAALERLLAKGAALEATLPDGTTALHLAANHTAEHLIATLVAKGLSVGAVNARGRTPLHVASMFGCPAVVERLLEHKANPNLRDAEGRTPLDLAVEASEPLTVDALIEGGACDGAPDVLHRAVAMGSVPALELLAQREPRAVLPDGSTLLHCAARLGQVDLLGPLFEAGVPVDARDEAGQTALHVAAFEGVTEAMRTLLHAGADPNAQNVSGHAPLHLLAHNASPEQARMLVEAGADVHLCDANGRTPFEFALELERYRALEALASVFIPPENPGYGEGWTAVHFAAAFGSRAAIAALAERNLLSEASDDGFTVLHQAAILGNDAAVDALLLAGADPNAAGAKGRRPLHLAVTPTSVERLVAAGARVDQADDEGNTPLHVAYVRGLPQVVEALLRLGAPAEVRNGLGLSPAQMQGKSAPKLNGPDQAIQIAHAEDEEGRLAVDPTQAQIGRAYIDKVLDQGHPALVGVSYSDEAYNRDKMTDHFVTIYRRGYDESGRLFYEFKDPGAGGRTGRLYVDQATGKLFEEGDLKAGYVENSDYEVTQVRTYKGIE